MVLQTNAGNRHTLSCLRNITANSGEVSTSRSCSHEKTTFPEKMAVTITLAFNRQILPAGWVSMAIICTPTGGCTFERRFLQDLHGVELVSVRRCHLSNKKHLQDNRKTREFLTASVAKTQSQRSRPCFYSGQGLNVCSGFHSPSHKNALDLISDDS